MIFLQWWMTNLSDKTAGGLYLPKCFASINKNENGRDANYSPSQCASWFTQIILVVKEGWAIRSLKQSWRRTWIWQLLHEERRLEVFGECVKFKHKKSPNFINCRHVLTWIWSVTGGLSSFLLLSMLMERWRYKLYFETWRNQVSGFLNITRWLKKSANQISIQFCLTFLLKIVKLKGSSKSACSVNAHILLHQVDFERGWSVNRMSPLAQRLVIFHTVLRNITSLLYHKLWICFVLAKSQYVLIPHFGQWRIWIRRAKLRQQLAICCSNVKEVVIKRREWVIKSKSQSIRWVIGASTTELWLSVDDGSHTCQMNSTMQQLCFKRLSHGFRQWSRSTRTSSIACSLGRWMMFPSLWSLVPRR